MNKKQIKVSFIDRLTQFDFAMLVKDVIKVLEAINIDYPLITNASLNLKKYEEQLLFYGMHPKDDSLSQELKELDELRIDYFVALKGVIRARLKSNNPVERDAAQGLTDWIKRNRKKLDSNARHNVILGIGALEDDRKYYISIDSALDLLGLKNLFIDLYDVSRKSLELAFEIYKSSGNSGEAAIELRKEVTFELKRFLRAIDVLAMIGGNGTEEILNLRNSLLFTLEGYRVRNLQRIAATKRGKKWKERDERRMSKIKRRHGGSIDTVE